MNFFAKRIGGCGCNTPSLSRPLMEILWTFKSLAGLMCICWGHFPPACRENSSNCAAAAHTHDDPYLNKNKLINSFQ
jgi:hypothetical protein